MSNKLCYLFYVKITVHMRDSGGKIYGIHKGIIT